MIASSRARWEVAALMLALTYAGRTMAPALDTAAVQNDAREHVFWMARFRDPALFPNDFIADFFQSLAPLGYQALYRLASPVVDPLTSSKLFPPLLGLAIASMTFRLALQLYNRPLCAFLASVLTTWYSWQHDDLPSGTPRAFCLPFLCATLWAYAAGRRRLLVLLVPLSALFYPVTGVLLLAMLGTVLLVPDRGKGWPCRDRREWRNFGCTAALLLVVLFVGQRGDARYGPIVTLAQARTMREFQAGGLQAFFGGDPYAYWLASYRSGFDLRVTDPVLFSLPVLFEYALLAAGLPLLLWRSARLRATLRPACWLLGRLAVASLGLFLAAHALLFQLYLPNRWVKASIPLVLSIAGGLALGLLVVRLARSMGRSRWMVGEVALAGLVSAFTLVYPARWYGAFGTDPRPELTAFLRGQPREVLIAGPSLDLDQIPPLAARRILASRKYSFPYRTAYYDEIRSRLEELIVAYYSDSLPVVLDFAGRRQVDLFVVDRQAYYGPTLVETWSGRQNVRWEPFTSLAGRAFDRSVQPALLTSIRRCAIFDDSVVAVVSTTCLSRQT